MKTLLAAVLFLCTTTIALAQPSKGAPPVPPATETQVAPTGSPYGSFRFMTEEIWTYLNGYRVKIGYSGSCNFTSATTASIVVRSSVGTFSRTLVLDQPLNTTNPQDINATIRGSDGRGSIYLWMVRNGGNNYAIAGYYTYNFNSGIISRGTAAGTK